MMKVGNQAPDFTLQNQAGEDISLSDFKGQNVILYFYPKDMTPGCTTQACDFRDQYEEFSGLDAVILGVSPDPIESHQKFIDKYDLPFHLLADKDNEVAKQYEVWQLKKMFGKEFYGIVRSTFMIDKEGKLVKEFRNVRAKGHVGRVLSSVQEQVDA